MNANNDVRILASRASAPIVRRELSRRGFLAVAGRISSPSTPASSAASCQRRKQWALSRRGQASTAPTPRHRSD